MENGISIGISVCALIISIISPIFEYAWSSKINQKNLYSEYFKEMFNDIIYVNLPKAREYIHFDGQNITGTEDLEKVMRLLRQKIIYFKHSNPDFYSGLLSEIQDFENFLVTKSGKADSGSFATFHNKVDEHIENIYIYMNNMYLGKKTKKRGIHR